MRSRGLTDVLGGLKGISGGFRFFNGFRVPGGVKTFHKSSGACQGIPISIKGVSGMS